MKRKIKCWLSALLSIAISLSAFAFSSAVFARGEIALKSDSYLSIDGEYLKNVKSNFTAGQLLSHFKGSEIQVSDKSGKVLDSEAVVGTGDKVTSASGSSALLIVIKGDLTGDGTVDATDYLRMKMNFLGTYDLSGAYFLAGDVEVNGKINATDYLRIKAHFLGNYDLYPESASGEPSSDEPYSGEYFEVLYKEGQVIYNNLGASELAPSYFQDFSEEDITNTFYDVRNVWTEKKDGFVRFTAQSGDPYLCLEKPSVLSTSMKYLLIGYRTSVATGGEIFVNRKLYEGLSDGPQMGQAGTHVAFDYGQATGLEGEFKKVLVDISSICFDKENFSAFRIDVATTEGAVVDIQYVAGFSTRAGALNFDYNNYQGNAINAPGEVQWPDPVYVPQKTTPEDNKPSTVKIEDLNFLGMYKVTYERNGETKTFTTLGNQNLSGGFAATDDTGATLSDSFFDGAYGTKDRTDVGMFYFLWMGEHGDWGANDNNKIIAKYGTAAAALRARAWDPAVTGVPYSAMYHWGEPLYGYYYSSDEWVIRKHMELLTNANIDFLFFDCTNGYAYVDNAKKIMKVLHDMNEQGFKAPKVVFYTNTNSSATADYIYKQIYAVNYYPDTWYGEIINWENMEFKPYIVASGYTNDFFLVKSPQWPDNASIPWYESWPWMDFDHDGNGVQTVYNGGNVSVSIAQHKGTTCFSMSAFYGNKTNSGRTTVGSNEANSRIPVTKDSYKYGYNFQNQWDNVFNIINGGTDLNRVFVTGWNEWVAQKQPGNAVYGDIFFVDCATPEYSRDLEMTRGLYFDNYYTQLLRNVSRLNGSSPIIIEDGRKSINVTGDFSQWDDVAITFYDPSGDCSDRYNTSFGRNDLQNQTGRNDIVAAKVINDTKNIYFYVETKNDISMYDTSSSWMQLFVSTDENRSNGWYGYDYVINYKAKDCFTTTVAKNVKEGAYSFETIGDVSYRVKDNKMMIAVPLELLGITDYTNVTVDFKWADSTVKITNMEGFYELGDSAPLGRPNFVFRNDYLWDK